MSKSVTSRSHSLPLFKTARNIPVAEPISLSDAESYRPGAIQHMDKILKQRHQTLVTTERKLTNAKSLLALCAVYAIVMTIIAVGGAL